MSDELRGLGRTVELRPTRTRRPWVALVAVLVLGATALVRATDADEPTTPTEVAAPADAPAPSAGEVAPEPVPEASPPRVEAAPIDLPLLGRVGTLELFLPATEAVLVSYHEASLIQAMPITPFGEVTANENASRELVAEQTTGGSDFHVQVSRGRANGPTSAVDVVLAEGVAVRAPVSGTITEVRPYQLYGRHDDVRIELLADDVPDRAVVLIHVQDVQVRAGDRVEVGDVLAGGARAFPFDAVVDRQTAPERFGHVHIEVKAPSETPPAP